MAPKPASTAGKALASTCEIRRNEGSEEDFKRAAAAAADGEKKKSRNARKEKYSSYIYKGSLYRSNTCLIVIRVSFFSFQTDMCISYKAMAILNRFGNDFFERIAI
jgi:hypothetical protein